MLLKIKKRLQQEFYYLKKFRLNDKKALGQQVKFHNFWDTNAADNWLYSFLKSRGFLEKYPDVTISFFSVYGPRYIIDLARCDIKIFFTGENVFRQRYRFRDYQDLAINKVDLALGFRDLTSPKYVRFPLWIKHLFDPDSTENDIRKRCKDLSNLNIKNRSRFAAHVSRHDDKRGIRSGIIKTLSQLDRVDCAGSYMNNTEELKKKFNDNKIEFLKNYRFNICPENSNNKYYVTEKLVHAMMAGCIPIYWGANGCPEPEIFNQDAIIYWNDDDSTLEKIKEINNSEKTFKEFAEQPRLKPSAAEKVIEMFRNLEEKLSLLFEQASHSK